MPASFAECGNSSSAPFFTRVVPFAGDASGETVFTASNTRVYRSTNYANSWSAVGSTGLPADIGIRNFGVSPTNGNHRGIAATAGRIFLSTNGGASWARWGNNLPLVNVTDLNFSIGSRVRAATYGRGFWKILQ